MVIWRVWRVESREFSWWEEEFEEELPSSGLNFLRSSSNLFIIESFVCKVISALDISSVSSERRAVWFVKVN